MTREAQKRKELARARSKRTHNQTTRHLTQIEMTLSVLHPRQLFATNKQIKTKHVKVMAKEKTKSDLIHGLVTRCNHVCGQISSMVIEYEQIPIQLRLLQLAIPMRRPLWNVKERLVLPTLFGHGPQATITTTF
jgi:hypothetical protein